MTVSGSRAGSIVANMGEFVAAPFRVAIDCAERRCHAKARRYETDSTILSHLIVRALGCRRCEPLGKVGGSVWESNPPFGSRRVESPALKAGRITGPLAPPLG
jgi:hypothetical protein